MKLDRLREILAQAAEKRISVAGDLMLDEFVWGKVGRISPEAPVPVVEVTGESCYPGGAANVARNLREFIGGVSVIGTVGVDPAGQQLLGLLREQKIDTALVLEDRDFPHDREDADRRAESTGRPGRSRSAARADCAADRGNLRSTFSAVCRNSMHLFSKITARVFSAPKSLGKFPRC